MCNLYGLCVSPFWKLVSSTCERTSYVSINKGPRHILHGMVCCQMFILTIQQWTNQRKELINQPNFFHGIWLNHRYCFGWSYDYYVKELGSNPLNELGFPVFSLCIQTVFTSINKMSINQEIAINWKSVLESSIRLCRIQPAHVCHLYQLHEHNWPDSYKLKTIIIIFHLYRHRYLWLNEKGIHMLWKPSFVFRWA